MIINSDVLSAFGFDATEVAIEPVGSGLINHTWKIASGGESFILQQVNSYVFSNPLDIAHNIDYIAAYLSKHKPDYEFVAPIKSIHNESLIFNQKAAGYFRLFPFVKNSVTKQVLQSSDEAFEAAKQFGRFTQVLQQLDNSPLKTIIPHFHDLTYRYAEFQAALEHGNKDRLIECADMIHAIKEQSTIVEAYQKICNSGKFLLRVTHHDTKISNVLFNETNKGICVIDLDTVMPGFFISDVGDMMRTYLSPVNEEESDFSKIQVRPDFFNAIREGYLSEMGELLTNEEKGYFFYAGQFLIYMQALRFLTDYLSNDSYYGSKYQGQNLVRAGNQLVLLQRLTELNNVLLK